MYLYSSGIFQVVNTVSDNTIKQTADQAIVGVRRRLIDTAEHLLESSGELKVSTREVCERSGVQAPTLYHYFGSKEGLLQAVAQDGFDRYLHLKRQTPHTDDPIQDLMAGWDIHVTFGLRNPHLYLVMFGRLLPEQVPAGTARAELLLEDLCHRAAALGLLRVPPRTAAIRYLSANISATLTLITHGTKRCGDDFSCDMRQAALSSIIAASKLQIHAEPAQTARDDGGMQTLCLTLQERLAQDSSGGRLSPAEQDLLNEWLTRLSR